MPQLMTKGKLTLYYTVWNSSLKGVCLPQGYLHSASHGYSTWPEGEKKPLRFTALVEAREWASKHGYSGIKLLPAN